jgi:NADH dehydrogenase
MLQPNLPKKLHPIWNGSRIAIVGGGVAGSFFALCLRRFAEERGIAPEIVIYEQRDFNDLGPKGCKGCAGILSTAFLKNLADIGLIVPDEIVQSKIVQYEVHSPYTSVILSNPITDREIYSIYRGGGPQVSSYENKISFNGWLLREAQKKDVKVDRRAVKAILVGPEAWVEFADGSLEYDLVVLAAGVNSKPIEIKGLNYIPAATRQMSQNELYAGTEQVEACLGKKAHVFLVPHSDIIFGTLVPKGPFINVSVLSKAKSPYPIKDFLNLELVRSVLPQSYERACACNPRIASGIARNFYADRFVAVGDAAVSRLYKDGIGSSLLAAKEAARTVIQEGFAKSDFNTHYLPLCQAIHKGNNWGKIMFFLNDLGKNSKLFLFSQNRIIGNEQHNIRRSRPFTKSAWGMFTGSYGYEEIARMTLNPASLARLAGVSMVEGIRGLLGGQVNTRRSVYVGSRNVLILGSGFGGSYIFRHLLPSLNSNENVETTMISNENFFLFTPLLHEVAMGKIETRHVAFPIRRLHWKDRFNFIQDMVQKIDLDTKTVYTTNGEFGYDYLVISLGSVTDTSKLGPARESVFTLKTLYDSMVIRNHIIEQFERATAESDSATRRRMLTFVVCGAGYTGVQLVTELTDFIQNHLAKFYRTIDPGEIRAVLVESDQKILAGLQEKMSAYALRQLQKKGIELRLNSRVTGIQDSHIEVNGTECLDSETVIWVAGVISNPVVAELSAKTDRIGRVLVDQYMEVPGYPGVYAVGDCAHSEDPVTGKVVPPRAHNTIRQAKVVAHNILAELRGWDKKPYRYTSSGEAVSLGSSKAVARFYNFRFYGFPARLIWITAYSFLATGTYNRIRIITDWGLSFIFGRDTTILKLKK